MDATRLATVVRVVRIKRSLRQADLAALARVSQSAVSRLERGRLEGLSIGTIDKVADALGIRVVVDGRWNGGDALRLADAGHAVLVDFMVSWLRAHGWTVVPEYTFSRYGERGSVDVLGWHPARSALLVVEVKTRILDLQELLAVFDRKARVAPLEVARERGWVPKEVGRFLVIADTAANRSVVRTHAAIFDAAFPVRSWGVRRWTVDGSGDTAGIWFVSRMRDSTRYYDLAACRRVRKGRVRGRDHRRPGRVAREATADPA